MYRRIRGILEVYLLYLKLQRIYRFDYRGDSLNRYRILYLQHLLFVEILCQEDSLVLHLPSDKDSAIITQNDKEENPNEFQERREILSREERISSFQRLEALVEAKGIKFYKLAKELGFAQALFSDWKSGKSMPKTDKLLKIANFFGVTIDYFL